MRPIKERLCVALWAVWTVWSLIFLAFLFQPYVAAKVESFPALGESISKTSFAIPRSVATAYKSGQMTEQERREFETDLRNGTISLPEGERITIPPRYPPLAGAAGNFFLFIILPALSIALIQYLFIGLASPLRLFRK